MSEPEKSTAPTGATRRRSLRSKDPAAAAIATLESRTLAGQHLDTVEVATSDAHANENHTAHGSETQKREEQEVALVCLRPPSGAEVDDNSDVPAFGLRPEAFDWRLLAKVRRPNQT